MSYKRVRWPHAAGLIPCHGSHPPVPHKAIEFMEGWQRPASDKWEGNTESDTRAYETWSVGWVLSVRACVRMFVC